MQNDVQEFLKLYLQSQVCGFHYDSFVIVICIPSDTLPRKNVLNGKTLFCNKYNFILSVFR